MSRRRQKLRQQAYWSEQPGLFDLPAEDENAILEVPAEAIADEERLRFFSFGSGSSGNCAKHKDL